METTEVESPHVTSWINKCDSNLGLTSSKGVPMKVSVAEVHEEV